MAVLPTAHQSAAEPQPSPAFSLLVTVISLMPVLTTCW
jgi:hypothetical protein